jgi:hypothetical protein
MTDHPVLSPMNLLSRFLPSSLSTHRRPYEWSDTGTRLRYIFGNSPVDPDEFALQECCLRAGQPKAKVARKVNCTKMSVSCILLYNFTVLWLDNFHCVSRLTVVHARETTLSIHIALNDPRLHIDDMNPGVLHSNILE